MIAQNFEYETPASLKEALALLSGGEAKILAGGMSLIPMMKLRLAAPDRLVDLRKVPGLSGITEDKGSIRIGAMTTHHEIEDSPLLRGKCPLLAETASNIGDVQVRNMGTIGGSVAHADPAADYPAALLALEANVRLVSAGSERTISLVDFLVDTMTTAIEPGEILQEVMVPVEAANVGVSYQKMVQPASGFAIVGIAARVGKKFARVGVTGLAGKAYRASNVEKIYLETGDIKKAAAVVADGVDANSDLFASSDYRKQMARVYTARALTQALGESFLKIGGSYTVPLDPQRAYAKLQDPEILAQCMPGADHLDKIGEDEYEMKMKIAIASVQGLFGGKVRIADRNPPHSFRLMVEGTGKVGFVKGEGLLSLIPVAAGTEVKYDGDVQVGGMIAGVGQRLIDVTAKLIIKKFFEKLTAIT